MLFTLYRTDTGEILKKGHCLEGDLDLQAGDGEAVWPGEALDDEAWLIIDGEKVPRAPDLGEVERGLLTRIDRAADDIHARIMPKSPSLIETHRAKKAEAVALMQDPATAEALTPRLSLEAASLGITREDCAAIVLARAAEDETLSALIDDIRRAGKNAVRAAETDADKRAAAEAIDWSPVTG